MINKANYLPIFMLSTKTNAADQSQFSMTQKLANYVGENSDASTLPQKNQPSTNHAILMPHDRFYQTIKTGP